MVDQVHIYHIFEGQPWEATRGWSRGQKPRPFFADFWGINLLIGFSLWVQSFMGGFWVSWALKKLEDEADQPVLKFLKYLDK